MTIWRRTEKVNWGLHGRYPQNLAKFKLDSKVHEKPIKDFENGSTGARLTLR